MDVICGFEELHSVKIVNHYRNIYTIEGFEMYQDIIEGDKEEKDLICIVDYFSSFVIAINKQEILIDGCNPADIINKYGMDFQNIIIEEVKNEYLEACFKNFDILKLGLIN